MFSLFSTSLYNHKDNQPQAGFGLVELMVSISIVVIVTAIILVKQTSFNGAVLLRSQAYEVALQIRDVQLSAISASGDGSGNFRSVVGVHFDAATDNNSSYRIFSDADGPADSGYKFYNVDEEFGLQGILDPRFEIRDIRSVGGTGTYTDTQGLSVVFLRPDFDAEFTDVTGLLDASSVEVDVARRDATGTGPGDIRTVEITSTGQISVR